GSTGRKFIVGLGILALGLTGYLALRPAKKISPITEETPATLIDAAPIRDAARKIDAPKRNPFAPKFNLAKTDAPPQPSAAPRNLRELFTEMKDSPIPVLPAAKMDIALKKFICPDDIGFDGEVGVYDRGNLIGYLNIGRGFDDDHGLSSDWLDYSLYRSIINERGEKAGYQQVQPYMSPNADFVSLGGRISAAKLSQGAKDYIYGPGSLLPFGQYDKGTEQLIDMDGNALGGLSRDERYLELTARPSCLDETFEGAGFIEFPSLQEFNLFKGQMGQSDVWKQE
ncbi:MAG TPA: hypothetical protein VMT55_01645, partial [Candidatus Sulfotelmatobacter sp.]|nr:hypothetical protein [Candidatus Sulfotelmatobacter sp.]